MMFKLLTFLLLQLFLVHSDPLLQNKISQSELYSRLSATEQYSYFECQSVALYIRQALKNHVPLPDTPQRVITENDVPFVLFTKTHPSPYTLKISPNEVSIRFSPFNAKKRTVLFVNGYGIPYSSVIPVLPQGLLNSDDVNVILVDYDSYAFTEIQYFGNITVPLLGGIVGRFVQQLIAVGSNPKQMYFIGYSAGAEVVGLAAKRIKPKIARLLAMEPGGNCYNYLPPSQRVDRSDADFVEMIYCSTGFRSLPGYILGHATFYLNGGFVQPSCYGQTSIVNIVQCSHTICYNYLLESLYNFDAAYGIRCNSYSSYLQNKCNCQDRQIFGYYTPSSARGLYFVDTEPYSHSSQNLLCSERKTWF